MRTLRRILIAAGMIGAVSVAAAAQEPGSGKVLQISPYAGMMISGNLADGPLGTGIGNAPGFLYGTQVGLALAPGLSLIGNVGYSKSEMKVGIPIIGGFNVGNSQMLLYDAGLEYNLGKASYGSTPFSPIIQAGVGAIRYDIKASVLETRATNLAGNIGVGADVAVSNGIALRLLAKE